ncbi:MAG: tyrosine-protein phosphatase [Prevotella sp.]|nr:tyrosine-protein phosphatase [Prevotella sp.]
MSKRELNLRELGGIPFADGTGRVPGGVYWRSGKFSVLSADECVALCRRLHIACVIDLRTPVEVAEFPDPLPPEVTYLQMPLLNDSAVGITHETGSDPMTIMRSLRKHPEKLLEMIPDFSALYTSIVTDDFSRAQLDKVVATLRANAEKGLPTLFHCTAGKDRTGIVSMALFKSYGVGDEEIVKDYLRTNRNAFWPTVKKCVAVAFLTKSWRLTRTVYQSFMADRRLIETAIKYYEKGKV